MLGIEINQSVFQNLKIFNPRQSITFIDQTAIADHRFISSFSSDTELIVIQSDRDGIEQITETLADREHIASLKIIGSSNMSDTNLQLGISQPILLV